jgi:OmpA-OmpF porin, OOP family
MQSLFKYIRFSLLVLCLWSGSLATVAAQGKSDVSPKARKLYEQAEDLLKARKFDEAIASLKKATAKDPDFAEAHFRLGTVFELLLEHEQARTYYEKSVQLRPDYRPFLVAYGVLGDYALQEGNYAQAREYFTKYLALKPVKSARVEDVKLKLASCDFAEKAMQNPVPFKPVPLNDKVNQYALQYYPALTADQQTLMFTAKRSAEYSSGDEDLYISYRRDGDWSTPEPVKEINTPGNEGAITISADGRTLVFTGCQGWKGYGSCDLYIAYRSGDEWTKPVNMGKKINSSYWESQPSLSADGRTIYFVSDRPGGQGKYDIWVSRLGEDGEWSTPENLGPNINTGDFESSPFIHSNGRTLFFASKGRVGMGGADLYVSEMDENGNWSEARNLGYPINTHEDQVSLFVTADGTKGYYAVQERKGMQYVNSLLHEFDIPEQIAIRNKSDYLKGTVYDARTRKQITGARVELFNLKTGKLETVMASDQKTGEYLTVLTEGASYALYVNQAGYLFKSMYFDYAGQEANESLVMDVYLEPLVAGSKGILNNLFFPTGEYRLEDKSKTELNKLVQLMNENSALKLEISGHTDDVGKDKDNMELSTRRAKSVYDYLVQAGVPANRLTYKGYGETQFAVPNDSEKNRQLNRRIEFKVL